ncbi:hypothetical protein CAL7716_058780 [Calothrix sp. PCC 7716]|nr:hypothetical protein CAL7716_058780 [Calothrix sp. PCC 7716]
MRETSLVVDPGFVHHRKIEAILGQTGTEIISKEIERIPSQTPNWRKEVIISHIYSRITLDFCRVNEIKTLQQVLFDENGQLFCSIVNVLPCKEIYESKRVIIKCKSIDDINYKVEFHITSDKVWSETLKSGLYQGGDFAIVAQYNSRDDNTLIFHPLLIGYPYLADVKTGDLSWNKYTDFYQLHLEDFTEFEIVKQHPLPSSTEEMKFIHENVFKQCLGRILTESTPKDWGGESSDFFTSHLHIQGRRLSAAFLLKGPAKYSPMTLKHLGKNGDQIVRLSKEPANVLVIQHCHDILPPVIETLRVFATQPSKPRHYCFIDGRESLRMLKAFNLVDWAIEESTKLGREKK